MTHFPVSGSYRLGGREMRRGRETGSGGSRGGVGGIEESSSGLVGSWRSRFGECPPFLQFSPKVTICFKVIYFLTTRSH